MRLFPLILLLVAAVAPAQPPEVDRTLRTLDFEERRLGNAEDIPMHWTKATGAGLPHYVNGRLSDDRHRSGQFSFKFDLNGGSLIYRYEAGRIPVQRGAHYHIETFVQTTVLANARARLTASLADVDGRIIANTTRHSEAYSARTDDEPWHKLEIELAADSSDASSLILELELLQPHLYSPTTLGERALWPQDIHGSAWFDDVSVSQVPQVKMTTDRPGNIFRKGDTPRLQVVVNDRCTDDLAVQLVVRNARGKSVYQRSGALDMTTAEDLGPGRKKMALLLPELPPGWYEAALVMSSQGQFVGEQTLDLVLLADRGITRPDSRFGVDATQLPFDGWNELPDILPFLAAGRVKLAVWSSAGDIEQLDSASFDHLLERLGELGITPTACLLDLPPSVTDKLKPEEDKSKETSAAVGASAAAKPSWPRILKADPKDWQPQLAGLIARHANHLDRWQLGADGSDAFVTNKDMRTVYAAVYKQFSSLMQKPDLAMPWPAWYELEGELPATVALSVPSSVLPSQMPLYMQDLKSRDGHNLSLSLQLLDEAKYTPDLQIRDLAQRVIYALAADARRIDLPLPFTVRKSGDDVVKQPQEMLLILHTLISTLSNTTFRGKVPIAEGVEAFLFDRAGQGILVLWDRGSGGGGGGGGGTKHLPVNLGERPLKMDLWGNVSPLLNPADTRDSGQLQLDIGPMPIFLIDIDGPLAQLRASVNFDRPLVESSFQSHTRHLRFNNPYKQAISGSLRLKGPAGWSLNPPSHSFSLNPGETFDREITIEFPYNSFAGPKTINVEFLIQADKNTSINVPLTLTLGLSDVGMSSMALRDGKDVVVQQIITNYGDKPIDYTAFAIFPGQARQERLVSNLGPGNSTIKRYRFQAPPTSATPPAPPAPAIKVRAGIKELDGTRILNEELPVQ